jgi:hypothetical protein
MAKNTKEPDGGSKIAQHPCVLAKSSKNMQINMEKKTRANFQESKNKKLTLFLLYLLVSFNLEDTVQVTS